MPATDWHTGRSIISVSPHSGVEPCQVVAFTGDGSFMMMMGDFRGQAGSFGYEKEHYEVSMKIAEHALLPAVRKAPPEALIIAGNSCSEQALRFSLVACCFRWGGVAEMMSASRQVERFSLR